ncbi:TPA: adhesin, partial [Burkholderia multivorans]|nr:adhesin [Burkholderia multivorans]HDR9841752.1 adhesin [Burkholderia multivorans]
MARAAYRQKSMNRTYRTVWNAARGAIVAVSERDRANGKGQAGAGTTVALTSATLAVLGSMAMWSGDAAAQYVQIPGTNCTLTTTANSFYATAVGCGATASASGSVALGSYVVASGLNSAAIGYLATATAQGAAAFGTSSSASGLNSAAIGPGAKSSGTSSTAIGPFANAS